VHRLLCHGLNIPEALSLLPIKVINATTCKTGEIVPFWRYPNWSPQAQANSSSRLVFKPASTFSLTVPLFWLAMCTASEMKAKHIPKPVALLTMGCHYIIVLSNMPATFRESQRSKNIGSEGWIVTDHKALNPPMPSVPDFHSCFQHIRAHLLQNQANQIVLKKKKIVWPQPTSPVL